MSVAARDVTPGAAAARWAGLAAAAGTLAGWLLAPPDAAVLARVRSPQLLDTWPLPCEGETARGIEVLRRSTAGEREVAADHARLFVGPGHVLAPPYESVHRSPDGLLFGEETLQVRQWFGHYGIRAPRQGREPDDHLGLELEFVATLLTWAVECQAEGAADDAERFAAGARAFMEQHVCRWAPTLFEAVEQHARTDVYRALALLGRGLVEFWDANEHVRESG